MLQKKFKTLIAFLIPIFFILSCQSSKNDIETGKIENLTTLAPFNSFDSQVIDGVLVSIGDQVILLSDLQQSIQFVSHDKANINANGQILGEGISPTQAQEILDGLINQKLLQIQANELGINISDDDLSQRISDFLKQQGLTEDGLKTQLAQSGKTMNAYRIEFKEEILKQQVIGKVISPLVTVSDDEVKSFYLQQTGRIKQISALRLRALMLNMPVNSNPNSIKTLPQVQEIQKKLLANGNNFEELVKTYSIASNAKSGGQLPPRTLAQLPSELRSQISHLDPGQVVGPLIIGGNIFFFQYIGADFATNSDLQQNFASWKNKLQNIKFNERLSEYLKTERSKISINTRPFNIHV